MTGVGRGVIAEVLGRILSGDFDPVAELIRLETARGYKIVRPGDAPWFDTEWHPDSIASIDGDRVRLVLLRANAENCGTLSRTIVLIKVNGLVPTIVEPSDRLAEALARRGWRGKRSKSGEVIWARP